MSQCADVEVGSATKEMMFLHSLSLSLLRELNKFRLWADMTKKCAPNESLNSWSGLQPDSHVLPQSIDIAKQCHLLRKERMERKKNGVIKCKHSTSVSNIIHKKKHCQIKPLIPILNNVKWLIELYNLHLTRSDHRVHRSARANLKKNNIYIYLEILPKRDDVRQMIIIIGTEAMRCNKTHSYSFHLTSHLPLACNVIEQGDGGSIDLRETSVLSLLIK